MSRQYLIPGTGYINETGTNEYLVPGSIYVNESVSGGATQVTRSVSDTNTLSDAIGGAFGLFPVDTNTLSDTLRGSFGISPAETFSFSDGSTANFGLIPSDTETLSDAVSTFVASSALTQIVSDSINNFTDFGGSTVFKVLGMARGVSDTETLSDSISKTLTLNKVVPYSQLYVGLNDLV